MKHHEEDKQKKENQDTGARTESSENNSKPVSEDNDVESSTQKPSAVKVKLTSKAFLMPAAITAIVVALFLSALFQGWIVAATVNGGAVSRYKVISALEEQDGAAALSAFIDEKLIEQAIKEARVRVSAEDVNAEIADLTEQFADAGQSFEDVVAQQGLTQTEVRDQIKRQLELEALLADEVNVTDEAIETFITDNAVEVPEDENEAAEIRQAVEASIEQQELFSAYEALLTTLRAEANITYFVDYANN